MLTFQGQEYSFADVCVESAEYSGTTCMAESILSKWEYDATLLEEEADDASILATVR